jgi:hypothetical protein
MLYILGLFFVVLHGSNAMAIEEPPYTVEARADAYEIRRYEKVLVAETTVQAGFEDAGNEAFRILADFIFGNNRSQTKISMTAPVTQQTESEKIAMTAPVTQAAKPEGGGFLVQFVMPKEYSIDTLPVPNDQRVTIREVPSRRIAVHRYSGSWSEAKYLEELGKFREALARDRLTTLGEPILSRFNSPFSLWFLRRNEIWQELSPTVPR